MSTIGEEREELLARARPYLADPPAGPAQQSDSFGEAVLSGHEVVRDSVTPYLGGLPPLPPPLQHDTDGSIIVQESDETAAEDMQQQPEPAVEPAPVPPADTATQE
jgi:hypothetical protein